MRWDVPCGQCLTFMHRALSNLSKLNDGSAEFADSWQDVAVVGFPHSNVIFQWHFLLGKQQKQCVLLLLLGRLLRIILEVGACLVFESPHLLICDYVCGQVSPHIQYPLAEGKLAQAEIFYTNIMFILSILQNNVSELSNWGLLSYSVSLMCFTRLVVACCYAAMQIGACGGINPGWVEPA